MLKRSGTAGLWLVLMIAPALAAPQATLMASVAQGVFEGLDLHEDWTSGDDRSLLLLETAAEVRRPVIGEMCQLCSGRSRVRLSRRSFSAANGECSGFMGSRFGR